MAAWERQPPRRPTEERVERATAQAALGRREAALESLAGIASPAARALAARCQLELGRLGAARATLRGFEEAALAPAEVAELAEIASRVYASHGKPERAGFWIRRALDETAGDPRAALLARLAAAGAAWDRQDAGAHGALPGGLPGRARRSRPRLALAPAPGPAGRRSRRPRRRGGGRRAGDARRPPAADPAPGRGALERPRASPAPAVATSPGPSAPFCTPRGWRRAATARARSTLALYNLAEIRLRQGRTQGVSEIVARSESENRRSGNLRALAMDAELWARYELAQGRPAAALAVCRGALSDLERQRLAGRPELRLLAARALGWLQLPEEAAAELAGVPAETLGELEPEERPAVLALAGDSEGARREAAGTPFAPLWEALLGGGLPPARDWEALAALDPYRAARLVFDVDLLSPGSAPAPWRREAIATFRKLGAAAPSPSGWRRGTAVRGRWSPCCSRASRSGRPREAGDGGPPGAGRAAGAATIW